jgi:hypothetical protein
MFMHLIFDGAFARTDVFWWPFSGPSFGTDRLPSVDRGWWNAPLEVVGLVLVVWVRRQVASSRTPEARGTC